MVRSAVRTISVVMLLVSATSHAQKDDPDTEVAKRHFRAGSVLYDASKYDEALREFQDALLAKPLPAFHYNIAKCLDRLERWDEAAAEYQKYLDGGSVDAREAAQVKQRIAELQHRADVKGSIAEEQIRHFSAQWPKLAARLQKCDLKGLSAQELCDSASGQGPAPNSQSPDGKTLLILFDAQVSSSVATSLGLASNLLSEPDYLAVVLEGPSGSIWGVPLTVFSDCNFNSYDFLWGRDGKHVLFATDTGHGDRIGFLDLQNRKTVSQGFASSRSARASAAVGH